MNDADQVEADLMVRAQRDWARVLVSGVIEQFDEHVQGVKNERLRRDIFSTLIGVGLGVFREHATQKEEVDPYLTEMVASLEFAEMAPEPDELKPTMPVKAPEGSLPS